MQACCISWWTYDRSWLISVNTIITPWFDQFRLNVQTFSSSSPFPSFAPSIFSVCHCIRPPDNRSLTLLFSQSGAQSFVHLFILSLSNSPVTLFLSPVCCSTIKFFLSSLHSFFVSCSSPQSFYSLPAVDSVLCCLSLNLSSSVLSFRSPLSLSFSLCLKIAVSWAGGVSSNSGA